jgi:hypothetical protein
MTSLVLRFWRLLMDLGQLYLGHIWLPSPNLKVNKTDLQRSRNISRHARNTRKRREERQKRQTLG